MIVVGSTVYLKRGGPVQLSDGEGWETTVYPTEPGLVVEITDEGACWVQWEWTDKDVLMYVHELTEDWRNEAV